MQRHVDFEGIENFRDFGGYDTACGRGLKTGRLYRSGHLGLATGADLARMEALGIAAIADLRQPSERLLEPRRRWDSFAGEIIESDAPSLTPDWVEALKTASLEAEFWYDGTLEHYRQHAFEPRHIEVFRRLLRRLAEDDGAVVVHCAAGKDRTGVACALIHHVAGVPREAMIADYLLTNDESRMARRIAQSAEFVERITGRRPTDHALRVAVSVYPAFLEAFFESVDARCGSMDAYVADVLGVDPDMKAAIHERILGSD